MGNLKVISAAVLADLDGDGGHVGSDLGERVLRQIAELAVQLLDQGAEGHGLARLAELGAGRHDGGEAPAVFQEVERMDDVIDIALKVAI